MSGTARPDEPQLLIADRVFTGWSEFRVTRGIERCASEFLFQAAGGWPGEADGWPFSPFAACTVRIDQDLVITGYVDGVEHRLEADQRQIRMDGRSKTADLVDCNVLLTGGEFRDNTFAAICRAIAAPFGVEVLDTAQAGHVVIPVEAADPTETCFRFLERMARQVSVLLADDAQGRLVLARTSAARCSSEIRTGTFISAVLQMQVEKRFDRYIVKGQRPNLAAMVGRAVQQGPQGPVPGGNAQPGVSGEIRDPLVPRYRPFVMQSEANCDPAQARARAVWQARRDAAASLVVKVLVPGWRQADGRLWQINELVAVTIPEMGLREEMLVATVSYTLDKQGRRTLLTLGLPNAYTPEPLDPRGGGGWIQRLQPGSGSGA